MRLINVLRVFLFVVFLILSFGQTQFSLQLLWERGYRLGEMAGQMFPPDMVFMAAILEPLRDTLYISLLGTGLGAVIGVIGTLICNSYVNRWKSVRLGLKTAIHLCRCIPVLILALLCTFVLGLGMWSGVAAITLSTGVVLARLGYEDSENSNLRPAHVLEYTGVSRIKAYLVSVWKQIAPGYFSNLLYLLESNVRNAAVLGFVGAGGIGLLLNEKLAWREYSKVGMILCVLYMVVLATEFFSEFLQSYLVKAERQQPKNRLLTGILFFLFFSYIAISYPAVGEVNIAALMSVIKGVVSPDVTMFFSLQQDAVPYLLFETFCIAFLGTLGGTFFALLFSVFACFRFFGGMAVVVRLFLLIFRAIPVLVYGILWIRVTGPGPFAGVLTLALCSIGLLAKRFLIAIDSIDLQPYRALRAAGVTVVPAVRWGIVPQVLPHYLSAIVYRMDINLREAAVLGLVGAGGIGTPLFLAMNHYEWEQAGSLLWGLIILVVSVGVVSEKYRRDYRLRKSG